MDIPTDFPERDRLKYLQAYHFKIKDAVHALQKHCEWRIDNLPCKLSINVIRILVKNLLRLNVLLEHGIFIYSWKRSKFQTMHSFGLLRLLTA